MQWPHVRVRRSRPSPVTRSRRWTHRSVRATTPSISCQCDCSWVDRDEDGAAVVERPRAGSRLIRSD